MRLWKPILAVALLLTGVAGCGLSEYERRMDEQRKRVREFDETNRLLDDPIEMPPLHIQTAPTKTEPKAEPRIEPAWPFDPYLRLPKGYGSMISEKNKVPFNYPFPCFRYTGGETGFNIFVVAALIAESEKAEKFREYTPKHFRVFVQQAIEDFVFKTYNMKANLDKTPAQKIGIKEFTSLSAPTEDDEKKIVYERIGFGGVKNPATKELIAFEAYFHEDKEKGKQICIVVHRPARLPNQDIFNKTMEACLGSLDISNEGPARRTQFKQAKKRG